MHSMWNMDNYSNVQEVGCGTCMCFHNVLVIIMSIYILPDIDGVQHQWRPPLNDRF